MKKYRFFTLIYLLLAVIFPLTVHAQEISGQKNAMDITFVVDVSGSMRTNDPDGIAMDMVKAFIDTVHVQNIRVGFVAYNDKIVSSSSPIAMVEQSERERLKALIDSTSYSGNTDIGLGLSGACQLMPKEDGRNRIIVLISDGETDLGGSTTGRTMEQSNQDLLNAVADCRNDGVPVYTVAFGAYSGSMDVLENIASETGANTYTARNPQLLIEVLYDIFNHNLSYKIEKLSTGIYASGSQQIRCVLDEVYLNEIDILLISPRQIGESSIHYGEAEIPLTKTSYYAVGKIAGSEVDKTVKELTVNTTTTDGQQLDIYIINYRNLDPILNIELSAVRNQQVPYELYFKDEDGNVVRDETFYKQFQWRLDIQDERQQFLPENHPAEIVDGVLKGTLVFGSSGTYALSGELNDNLGNYQFRTAVTVGNTPPSGGMPEFRYTRLSQPSEWDLNNYFSDSDGDSLTYTIESVQGENTDLLLNGSVLSMQPLKAGVQTVNLKISDGEADISHSFRIDVIPLWQEYWWVIALLVLAAALILWKVFHKSKPELVQITEERARNHFNGKLNAYFTTQPEDGYEIPPLAFHLYKIKDNKICLGDLMKEYPQAMEQLGLEQIHFIADEDRKMILYHTADSTIMIGNSIACRRIQYHICFGDVIYITAPDEAWELELHYVAMIQ